MVDTEVGERSDVPIDPETEQTRRQMIRSQRVVDRVVLTKVRNRLVGSMYNHVSVPLHGQIKLWMWDQASWNVRSILISRIKVVGRAYRHASGQLVWPSWWEVRV